MTAIRQERVIRQGVAKQILGIPTGSPKRDGSDEETRVAVATGLGLYGDFRARIIARDMERGGT
jgi:hypothetical protein